jgi:hypothetical protein
MQQAELIFVGYRTTEENRLFIKTEALKRRITMQQFIDRAIRVYVKGTDNRTLHYGLRLEQYLATQQNARLRTLILGELGLEECQPTASGA